MVGEVFYEKCLSTIIHTLNEVKAKVALISYVKVWFLPLIKDILHLNGKVKIKAANYYC
jgi:hypothetical protein